MSSNSSKILIVGQGIAGTMLSWFFHKNEIDFAVIDDQSTKSPSQTSAGLINPVTGRRVVTVWLDDTILPFAEKAYIELGQFLNIEAISKTSIVDFFPNPFMQESFRKKISQDAPYISLIDEKNYLKELFNYEFEVGAIDPAYIVHLYNIIPAWQKYLAATNRFIPDTFDFSKLKASSDKIIYNGIEADKIIFCDGVQGQNNPYFSKLPFALNKGEALIIEAHEIPSDRIYKKSMALVPFKEKGIFWVGSNYIWDFEDDQPTEAFRASTEQNLKSWLNVPFKIIDHKASVRPATIERRPFVGFHPLHKNVGILNGLGTKGCSLAPYFANQLTEHIVHNSPIENDADVNRFSIILSKEQV